MWCSEWLTIIVVTLELGNDYIYIICNIIDTTTNTTITHIITIGFNKTDMFTIEFVIYNKFIIYIHNKYYYIYEITCNWIISLIRDLI